MDRRARLAVAVALLAAGPALAVTPDPGTEAQREAGRKLYDKYCAQCHGENGDGEGYATPRVKPAPRDFTSGKYKFRSTPSGRMPTDADLVRVIKVGLPYTSMPGWPMLNDTQIRNLVYYLKTFSPDFENPDKLADPIDLPAPPPITEESVARGREVYELQGCAACHGELGRGDGLSAPTLQDDWGNHIRPADMSQPWTYRGGATRGDIFRTFSTGLNGTPMPSYYDSLELEDRWHLTNYVHSLAESELPNYANLLVVAHVEEEIDVEGPQEVFDAAPKARFPLIGQIVEPGRNFYPSATSIEVQAVYNRREVAFRLRWNDMRADTSGSNSPMLEVPRWEEDQPAGAGAGAQDEGEDDFWGDEGDEGDEGDDFWGEEEAGDDDFWGEGEDEQPQGSGTEFSDAVAVQLPAQMPTGIRKPYFLFGDTQGAVDLWFVDLARGMTQQFLGRGSASLEPVEADEFQSSTSYDSGTWTVILKRELKARGGVSLEPDRFVPIAFSVWDGFNRERGNKRAPSAWFYLYTEPSEVVSPVGPMVRAGLITLVVELLVIFWIRRRFGAPPKSELAREPVTVS